MNERIKELTIRALAKCDPAKMTNLSSSVDNGAGVDIPLEFSEKFAQLVQQDCLQHLTNTGQDHAREILERYFADQ